MAGLVIIVGPIASGKSTVANGVETELRESGEAVAVVDLDDVVEMIGGFDGLTPERFRQAQLVCGQLVSAWLRQQTDVIAHGPFLQRNKVLALEHALPGGTSTARVHLLATFEVAAERLAADPARKLSADLGFLRATYDCVAALRPLTGQSDWTFDTTTMPSSLIINELTAALIGQWRIRARER